MSTTGKCGVSIADMLHDGNSFGFLLIHRLGGSPADLGFMSNGLARAGYSVCCPLLYGHGGSRDLLAATTWRQWHETVMDAHARLATRCDTIVIGGLGVGALLALHAAAAEPSRINGMALFAPTFWPNGWAMPWYGNALRFLASKRVANLFSFDERPPYGIKDDALRGALLETRAKDARPSTDVMGRAGGTMLEVKWMAREILPRLRDIRQPCLVFHPRHDDRSSLSASQLIQRRLGGVVDLIVLDDSYHHVTEDRQRTLVLDRVLEFADELPSLLAEGEPQPA